MRGWHTGCCVLAPIAVFVALAARAAPRTAGSSSPVARNLQSVVRLIDFAGRARASGFLFHARGGPGLALTNAHVTQVVTTAGMKLRLFDGSDAGVTRLLYEQNRSLDYALLEVALPAHATALAARMRAGKARPSRAA